MRSSDWSSDVCSSDLLDRLLQWGKTLGVAMLIEFDREIFISDFGRDLTKPSTKGNGRKTLPALIGLADHHGIVVETSYLTEELTQIGRASLTSSHYSPYLMPTSA